MLTLCTHSLWAFAAKFISRSQSGTP